MDEELAFEPGLSSSPKKDNLKVQILKLEKEKKLYEEMLKNVTGKLQKLRQQQIEMSEVTNRFEHTHLDDSKNEPSTSHLDDSKNEPSTSHLDGSASISHLDGSENQPNVNRSRYESASAEISKEANLPQMYYVTEGILNEKLAGQKRVTILRCHDESGKIHTFDNEKKQHAEIQMLEYFKENAYLPDEIWLSRTPCCDCAKELEKAYNKAYEDRNQDPPTIYVTSLYNGKGGRGIVFRDSEHIKQIIAVMKNGFDFYWWKVEDDLSEFQEETTTYSTQLKKDKKYLEEEEKVEALLQKCKNFSKIIAEKNLTGLDKWNWDELERIYNCTYEDVAHIVPLEVEGHTVILTMFKGRRVNIAPIVVDTEVVAIEKGIRYVIKKTYNDEIWQNGQERHLFIGYSKISMCPRSQNVKITWDIDVSLIEQNFIKQFKATHSSLPKEQTTQRKKTTLGKRRALEKQITTLWKRLSWNDSDKKFELKESVNQQ